MVPLPASMFSLASPSLEEVRRVIRKARNRSAPGPNGVPYLLYKRCPKVLYLLHSLIEKAWQSGKVEDEWKVAEGVYILISPSLFVLAIQLLLNAVGSNVPEAHLGKGLYMPSLKAFMDDTTLVMNRRPVVQNTLDTFNSLLGWCRMAFKPAKSRSLALVKGKICSDVSFGVAGQRVPTVSEEPVKSLGRVFNDSLTDKNQESDTVRQAVEGLQVIGEAPLQGRFKVVPACASSKATVAIDDL